jgi:hypothetical protein
MTRDEILDALEDEREKLMDAIEGLSEEAMQAPGVVGDWSVKDILFHLSMWEAELVKLLWQAAQGVKPTTVYFGALTVDELNAAWQAQAQTRPLELIMDDFVAVRKQTAKRVLSFSDQDLDDPDRYAWLKGQPLWKWIAEDSFIHEAEHGAQVRAWRARSGF